MSTILNNRYQLLDVMGRNNLTTTYVGTDTSNSSKIAIREYSASNPEQDTLEQFIADARLLMANNNLPGLCKILDVVEENNTAYVVMEFVEGVSIQSFIESSKKTFPVARVKTLMEPVIDSLAVLHEAGFIHQNISTDNLIFANDGQLRLVGFGGKALGFAPTEPRTPAMDVYGISAAIYKFITGIDPQDVEERKNNDLMKAPSLLGINISAQEEAVLMMGLNINMNERFKTLVAFKKPFYMTAAQSVPVAPTPMPQAPVVPQMPMPEAPVAPTPMPQAPVAPQMPMPEAPVAPTPMPQAPVAPQMPIPETSAFDSDATTLLTSDMETMGMPVPPQQPQMGMPVPPQQPQMGMPVPSQQPQMGMPVPPQQPQMGMPVPPQQPQMAGIVPPQAKTAKKKKGGNGGFIALIIIAVLLIAGLGATAYCIYTDNMPSFMAGLLGESVDEENDDDENTSAVDASNEDSTGENAQAGSAIEAKCQEFETMLAADNFQGVIDAVVAMDLSSATDDEKTKVTEALTKAIDAQYSSFEATVSNFTSSGDFDSALKAVDDQSAYFDKLAASEITKAYADKDKLENKKAEIKASQVSYVEQNYIEAALSGADEDMLKTGIEKLEALANDGIITSDELYTKSTGAYSRFVNSRVSAMNSDGTSAQDIYDFINERLHQTGNSLQAIEFADFYEAVLGKNEKNTKITHKNADGYLLPNSNSENLTTDDLSPLSRYELRLALYEIFARHGKTFNDEAVNFYFGQTGWFQKTDSFNQSDLNEFERYNIDLIIEYQKSNGYR